MVIEDLVKALEEQATQECSEIMAEAETAAERIIAEARAAAERTVTEAVEAADSVAEARRGRAMNALRLEVKREEVTFKGQAIDNVFDQALERLDGLRDQKRYAELFGVFAEEALDGVSGEAVLMVDPADTAIAERVAAGRDGVTVKADLTTRGGCVVALDGGRVLRKNTVEDRMSRVRHTAQARVAEILFG